MGHANERFLFLFPRKIFKFISRFTPGARDSRMNSVKPPHERTSALLPYDEGETFQGEYAGMLLFPKSSAETGVMKSIPPNPRSVALRRKHEAEISAELFQMSAEKPRTFEARIFAFRFKISSRSPLAGSARNVTTQRQEISNAWRVHNRFIVITHFALP